MPLLVVKVLLLAMVAGMVAVVAVARLPITQVAPMVFQGWAVAAVLLTLRLPLLQWAIRATGRTEAVHPCCRESSLLEVEVEVLCVIRQ